MFESSLSLTTRNRPVRSDTAPATGLFNPQDVPRCELLEHTIARIERKFRGSSAALASGRLPQFTGPAKPHHPSYGRGERHATDERCQ
jgi:hypothetical protein